MAKKRLYWQLLFALCFIFLQGFFVSGVSALTTETLGNGAYTFYYKNVNDITDGYSVYSEIRNGTASILRESFYIYNLSSVYQSISGYYKADTLYTVHISITGSSNLTFNCNNSDYLNKANYSYRFSGDTSRATDFTSFKTSCDNTNKILYITLSAVNNISNASNFVLYYEGLSQNYYTSLFYNGTSTNGTIKINVDKITSESNYSSIIVEQNETIIKQNEQMIEEQSKIYKNTLEIFDLIKKNQQDTTDILTDETPPELDSLKDVVGWLPPGPVDSILTLPLTVFHSFYNSLGKTCDSVYLPMPYINKSLELPCVNSLYSKIGISDYIETIGIIASAFILLHYLLSLYKWVDDELTLRENTWNDIDQWGGV